MRLRVVALVTVDQLSKSELCCRTKFVEGMSQETATQFDVAALMFKDGLGVVCRVYMPPGSPAATNACPSAEVATADHWMRGALFEIQVVPESVEV